MPPVVPALPPNWPRRLALLAPHPVLRLGLEVVLGQHGGVQVCGSFTDAAELLDLLQRRPDSIDLLLVDVTAPSGPEEGLQLLHLLSRRWPLLPVLVLSAHCNTSTVTMAMQAGARGFLSKETEPETLLRAVDVLARGGRFVPPQLHMQLDRPRSRRAPAPVLATLSRREREVIRLVLQGCTTGEVARRFGRTPSTISSQKRTAYRKLGIRSDGELFRIRHLLECG
ncbi:MULTISPECIES: response regulator [Stenotrophomonas]|uniref:response regulator n=1 Tax=Stenotrophomonas TaxID=40323 RepID=UPI0018D42916|nr:response regulator [Stenotrophomonas sp.]MBH1507461.1 response regulator transcription factor [Stenotrophomonas maltophilia]